MSNSAEFSRVTLDEGVSNKLRMLKGRTGLSRNYLCRVALCYSLREPQPPQSGEYDAEGQELGRHLLLGENDPVFVALLQERLIQEGRDSDAEFYEQLVAHINRGVEHLAGRIYDLADFYDLLPQDLKVKTNEE